jgi:hypothetical protein
MCFSAEADFVGGAIVSVIGVATLRETRDKHEIPLAALPIAFGLHQVIEGVVWLHQKGHVPASTGQLATYGYLIYAWALLPLLVPLSVLLVEPSRTRRRCMQVLIGLGVLVGVSLIGSLMHETITARVSGHTIVYGGAGSHGDLVTVLYVVATCGAFLLSSHRRIAIFGVLNLLAVLILAWIKAESLTSVWCAWGAVASLLIYLHFVTARRADPMPTKRPARADGPDGGSALLR